MAQSNSDDCKTPLGVYERAIREVTKARKDIEIELQNLKAVKASDLEALKAEFKRYQEQIDTLDRKSVV